MMGRSRWVQVLYCSYAPSDIVTALLSYLNSVTGSEYKMNKNEQEILKSWISYLYRYMIRIKGQHQHIHSYLNREMEFLQRV